MANRPVFVPNYVGTKLVEERMFSIKWAPGFSGTQKKKNVVSLHDEARLSGIDKILEISTKSNELVGQRLSSFSLKIDIDGMTYPLESVYQGCKIFELCGPSYHVFLLTPIEAKRYIRNLDCGRLVGFGLKGETYPLSPKNAFYDWLYIRSLEGHAQWIRNKIDYDAFTDIEFNPAKQVNCQARAFAEYLSLMRRGKLEEASSDFEFFASMLDPI